MTSDREIQQNFPIGLPFYQQLVSLSYFPPRKAAMYCDFNFSLFSSIEDFSQGLAAPLMMVSYQHRKREQMGAATESEYSA